jgi:undecaprenyl diphosphate synthase
MSKIPPEKLPRHVAVVMDGNGRWAQQRGLPRIAGHHRGEQTVNALVESCLELGIPYLTCFAFSTENWKRPPAEVRFVMGLCRKLARKRSKRLNELNVRMLWSGRRTRLWPGVIRDLDSAAELTANNTAMTLTLCINYGSRAEIADAAAAIAQDVADGVIDPSKVDEDLFAHYLAIPDLPDVDLFIRTSGEQRISNFLLWQSAYAEIVFVDALFPDFDRSELHKALEIYAHRNRRFGGVVT